MFRDLAAKMRAFAENEFLAVWIVRLRYDPKAASSALIGVANTYDRYGKEKEFHKKTLERALRIEL